MAIYLSAQLEDLNHDTGMVLLVDADGRQRQIPTAGMDLGAPVWLSDGLHFADVGGVWHAADRVVRTRTDGINGLQYGFAEAPDHRSARMLMNDGIDDHAGGYLSSWFDVGAAPKTPAPQTTSGYIQTWAHCGDRIVTLLRADSALLARPEIKALPGPSEASDVLASSDLATGKERYIAKRRVPASPFPRTQALCMAHEFVFFEHQEETPSSPETSYLTRWNTDSGKRVQIRVISKDEQRPDMSWATIQTESTSEGRIRSFSTLDGTIRDTDPVTGATTVVDGVNAPWPGANISMASDGRTMFALVTRPTKERDGNLWRFEHGKGWVHALTVRDLSARDGAGHDDKIVRGFDVPLARR